MPERSHLYSPRKVAAIVGLSRRTVYDWISYGWLRALHIGGRWFVAPADLDFFLQHSRGARGRLMPQLRDWSLLWPPERAE